MQAQGFKRFEGRPARVSVLAALYCLTARIGLAAAVAPGFATVFWPPSGVALAAILLGGEDLWPGIWLGSIGGSFWAGIAPGRPLAPVHVLFALVVGLGATLQALLSAWLVRRFVRLPGPMDQNSEISAFFLLAGPVSCSISATVGAAMGYASGLLAPAEIQYTWWIGWLGGTLGVFAVTPIALSIWMEPAQVWRKRLSSVVVPFFVVLGVLLAIMAQVRRWERSSQATLFRERALASGSTLAAKLESYKNTLYALRGLNEATSKLTRAAFHAFATPFFARQAGIQALEWVRRVQDPGRREFEDELGREGFAGYRIAERPERGALNRRRAQAEYFPVAYIEPSPGNEAALGFDMASSSPWAEALRIACDRDEPQAAPPVGHAGERGPETGVLLVLPVYAPGLPHDTVESRRSHLEGYALGVFRVDDMVGDVFENLNAYDIGFALFDVTTTPARPLFGPGRPPDSEGGFTETLDYSMGQGHWKLCFFTQPGYTTSHRPLEEWLLPVRAAVVAGFLVIFLMIQSGRAARVEELVRVRTAALGEANKELQTFVYSISHDLRSPVRQVRDYATLIERTAPDLSARPRQFLDRIQDCARDMDRQILDLLEHSRLNRAEMRRTAIDMNEVLRNATAMLEGEQAGRPIVWQHHPMPSVEGDPLLLRQVWINLLSNALKYTRGRTPAVIETGSRQDAAGETCFFVKDNGAGFDMRYAEKLFGVFQRLHSAEEFEGTGIGLANVKRIVLRHGGRVWAQSEVGKGALFCFTIGASQGECT